ncbi:stage II sporulation protein P [Neobacillus niacini]|uniref:stage II sporulation protein P n=1 Tax=Neobacillus niacini TaxID=86668 RepID=UPI0005F003C2|nr:stage II sporulation protein P [Neobacillus niacini]
MQTDKDLFDVIKEAYPLNPREDFVTSTSNKLKQNARKLNRKNRIKQLSFASTSIAICTIAISWFFFYGGIDVITNILFTPEDGNSSSTVNEQEPLVYIYQTPNIVTLTSETDTNDKQVSDEIKNITLVGERLSQALKERNVNSIHDETNISEIIKEKNLTFSQWYKASREPLKVDLEKNKSIKMVFDINRNTIKRNFTTININGKDYAKVTFVVSGSSINYKENIKFAKLLHNKIQKEYPRLSFGVVVKTQAPNQESTFNQDLFDNSVMLEIGGVENTLEEQYRTVDVLAEIFKDILKDENKLN